MSHDVDTDTITPDDLDDLGEIDFDSLDLANYEFDLKPFVHDLYIVDKETGVAQLGDVVHPAQDKLFDKISANINAGKMTRIIVLKARQIGISTAIQSVAFTIAMMLERSREMTVAHEMGSSEHLLSMSQNYYDLFWAHDAYTQKNKSSKILSWVETKSQHSISTAKNTGSGRSRTIHFLHGSEVAFWDNADTLMTGLAQAVPDTPMSFIFMESTANGIGNYFHIAWEEACKGENEYTPMFFPWWTHPEYKASLLKLPYITGGLDAEERKLVKLMRDPPAEAWNDYTPETPYTNREILDRLTWRRYIIKNKCDSDLNKFHQEYPSLPEEAFISTGTNVFPLDALDKVFEFRNGQRGGMVREGDKVRFQQYEGGKLKIFKTPVKGASYLVAADPKKATEGDYAAIQVLNRRTWEQVAVYRDKVDPVTLGEIMMNIGVYYNIALLAPEIQGGGYATVGVLLDRNYPNIWQHEKAEKMPGQIDNWFGWDSNWKTKNQALGIAKKVVVDQLIKLHDRDTYNEMKNYVALGTGKYGNGDLVDHDDMVMALAIAMAVTYFTMSELPPVDIFGLDNPAIPKTKTSLTGDGQVSEMAKLKQQTDEDVVQEAPWESWHTDDN